MFRYQMSSPIQEYRALAQGVQTEYLGGHGHLSNKTHKSLENKDSS